MYKELQQVRAQMTSEGQFEVSDISIRGETLKTFTNAPASLRDLWALASLHGDKPYLIYEDESWSYAEAYAETASIANWMHANDIKQGDRVALAFRNYPEWLLCYWALTSIGIAVVGMNAWWVTDEMQYGLEDSAPKAFIGDDERLARVLPVRGKFPDLKLIGLRLAKPIDGVIDYTELKNHGGDMPAVEIDGDEDACIFYTSGTTGRPKGAQLTQRGCVLNIVNIAFMGAASNAAEALANGDEVPEPDPNAPGPIMLVTTPMFHVTANNCVSQPATLAGGTLIFMYKWDAGEALKIIDKYKVTNMSGVPVMSREIIMHPDFDKYDTSSLVTLGGGGAQLQPDLVGKIDKALVNGRANTGYGMTETCGIITSVVGAFFLDRPESCGPLVPTLEGKVIDTDGNDLPQGETGELCVKGGNVIKGYLNREEATAESIQQGWLRTGDIARVDEDGFVFIVDRAKDMVLRGGENIY
ncbi:MAG: acyl--CoA ligase, partial [Alphaproteobacteria bacterium]|nr:acyl--CoA ligase [Alphaproteobacteria bacterium]